MAKLDDISIKTKDKALQEFIETLVVYWNRGLLGFKEIAAEPTDTPQDVEIRIFNSGAGAVRIYVFVPNSEGAGSGWWKTANLTEVT